MKKILLLSFIVLFGTTFSFGQETDSTAVDSTEIFDITTLPPNFQKLYHFEDSIMELSYMLLHDSLEEFRLLASQRLIEMFDEALKVEGSYEYPFERLKHISIQYPKDKAFRIMTWQLYVNRDEYRYFGVIQMNTKKEASKHFLLSDRSDAIYGSLDHKILSPSQWYGVLCYNIKKVEAVDGDYYLMFGYDAFEFFNRRKIVDVLTFQDGKPVFGSPVFVEEREDGGIPRTYSRLVVEYSAEAAVRVNYSDEYGLLLYDHLIPWGGSYKQGQSWVPDGSYEGYKLAKDGKWYHVSKVFNDFQSEAPRPNPVLDNRRGLFGPKEKKRNN